MNNLKERVAAIEARNAKVEQDKVWEISWTRRITITTLTFIVVTGYLILIDADSPVVGAFVAAGGFFLSILVLKSIRSIWERQ